MNESWEIETVEILQQTMAVAAVLALLGAALWWLRRRGFAAVRPRRNGGRLLKTLERLPLGPQHALHVVRVGERVLVVGCAPGACTLVADVAPRDLETAHPILP